MRTMTLLAAAALFSCLGAAAMAQDIPNQAVIGKSDWLFYSNEILDAKWSPETDKTIDVVNRFNRILADNGIGMAVVIVPMKMRIYREYLPDTQPLGTYGAGYYDRVAQSLRTHGVHVTDLNRAFLDSPKRGSDTPLFYRLDSHWSRTGALLAAETVKADVKDMPAFLKTMKDSQPVAYTLVEKTNRRPSCGRDLLQLLPAASSQKYAPEAIPTILVQKPAGSGSLTGDDGLTRIALVGSSYSMDWTGFADFLSYEFQRDIGNYSVPANQGAWVGMLGMLRDGAFQKAPPEMILWEMPERDMHAGPDFRFREERYRMPNGDWLLSAAAAVQKTCPTSGVRFDADTRSGNGQVGLKVSGNEPGMDFLDARVASAGNGTLDVELSGSAGPQRQSIPIGASGGVLRLPLTANGAAVSRVTIRGKGMLKLDGIRACRHPRDYTGNN